MSDYIDPPTVPEGLTIQEYRDLRGPRHRPLWKHALWWLGYHTHTKRAP